MLALRREPPRIRRHEAFKFRPSVDIILSSAKYCPTTTYMSASDASTIKKKIGESRIHYFSELTRSDTSSSLLKFLLTIIFL